MKILQVFLTIVVSISLHAGIEKHFKKCTLEKELHHTMRNIDFIYMISLKQRPEKYEKSCNQLHPYGIYPYRFLGKNGWEELSLEDVNELGVIYRRGMRKKLWGTSYLPEDNWEPHHEVMHVEGRNYFCHCMARGTLGIMLSQLSVLQDAYDSGYERVWVMEDDIEVIQNPHLISDRIDELDRVVGKDNWDILFTDLDTKNNKGQYVPCTGCAIRPNFNPRDTKKFRYRRPISKNLRIIGARFGAYSYVITRRGIKRILDFLKTYKIFLPYDMEFQFPPGITFYTVRDDIVSTRINAESDNGAPNYKK